MASVGDFYKPYLMLIVAFVSLLTLAPGIAHSELRAALSATQIEELDSVQLVIRDLGARDTLTPDLSGLEQDFLVLGVNTSSQYQFINGRAQSWVDYSITLQPKNTGLLTIAPIAVGNKRSKPLQLSVRKLSDEARREIDNLVFYELELSSDSVYVQSQLLLTRRLIYAEGVQLYGGQLEAPKVDSAQVFALGEGTTSVVRRNGRTMGSFEQRYAIFPERSGALLIPDESVKASVQSRQGATMTRKTVTVNTGQRWVEIKGIPAEYPSDVPWLPAIAVTANQRYTPTVDQPVKVGDTVNQTLTITVFGNSGASITPQGVALDSAIFKTYAQPASISNAQTGETLVGQRVESVDLVPVAGGAQALPGTTITWWNTDTDEVMTTKVQPVVLDIIGAAISPTRLPKEQAVDQPPISQLGGTVEPNANGLDWRILVLALLVLLALIAIRRRRKPSVNVNDRSAGIGHIPKGYVDSPVSVSAKQLLRSLDSDLPPVVRRKLITFLTQHYRRPQQQAFELFQASHPSAAYFLQGLSAACFGEVTLSQEHRHHGRQALLSLTAKTKAHKPDSTTALPALYPN